MIKLGEHPDDGTHSGSKQPPVTFMTSAQIARQVAVVFDPAAPGVRAAVLAALDPYGPSVVQRGAIGPRAGVLIQLSSTPPETVLEDLTKIAGVEFQGPNLVLRALQAPDDPLYSEQWALDRIAAPGAWRCGGAPQNGVVVAIVDSGIDTTHPDLPAPTQGIFATGTDEDGHGTMLAGTIGAVTDNATGVAAATWPANPVVPVNPRLQFVDEKFFDARIPPTSTLAAMAITDAVDRGAHVINASWDVGLDDPPLRAAFQYAATHDVLIVAAAGNDGTDNDRLPTYPASYAGSFSNVLSVMATDRNDDKVWFSNYGEHTVQVAAPGVDVLSTYPWLPGATPPSPQIRPGYRLYSGTSAAAALVTSAAALLKAIDAGWTAPDLRDHLIASGDPLIDPPIYQRRLVGGRLNLERAVCGPLRVLSPHQGVTWHIGTLVDVTWQELYVTPGCQTVRILLSTDGGATYPVTLASAVPNDPSPSWSVVVPNIATSQARLKLESEQRRFSAESSVFDIKP